MPVHDWSRVNPGIFHHFHHAWIEELQRVLNHGLLPKAYYALAEQYVGEFGPDVLTLQQSSESNDNELDDLPATPGALALAPPPKVRFTATTEMQYYVEKQNSVVIRHSSGDQVVALVEVVSPGNKSSRHALRRFVEKAADMLFRGYHLLILDVNRSGPRDPHGIHGAIWEEIEDDTYRAPEDETLTLAAYASGRVAKQAYVEPVAIGDSLPDMPLFLTADACVHMPLEKTYQAAWSAVPQRWQRVLDGT